jgi:hypothetical protein
MARGAFHERRGRVVTLAVSLLAAVGLAGCGDRPTGVPPAPSLTSGPAGQTTFTADQISGGGVDTAKVAESLCKRLAACDWIGASDLSLCVKQIEGFLFFVIDGSSFTRCINKLTCEELTTSNVSKAIEECMNLDEESLSCSGGKVRYCTLSGQCAEISCDDLCEKLGQYIDVGDAEFACCNCSPREYNDQPLPGG